MDLTHAVELTLTQALSQTASKYGDKSAFRIKRDGEWDEIAYNEAVAVSQAFAQRLIAEGYEAGQRVIIIGESQPEWALAYFGCVAAGLIAIPLDPQTPMDEALAIRDFASARCFIASKSLAPHIEQELAKSGSLAAEIPVWPFESIRTEPISPADELIDRAEPNDPASIIFIAGTKIDARGAMLTHRNLLSNVAGVSHLLQPFPTDEFLSVLPLNAGFEFTNGLLIPLSVGATITYAGSLNPRKILATLDETRATVMLGIPRLFQMCADLAKRRASESGETTGSELRKLFGDSVRVSGGAALDPDVYADFESADMPIHEGYGLTEASPVLTVNPFRKTKQGSVGPPVPGVEIVIDSPDAEGVGEVAARGPNIMRGYFNNPTATEAMLRDGWLCTGDLGYRDDDGYLYITGRIKDLIVTSAGKNVYPDEVEFLYKGAPHVREMCVVGIKDEQRREEVHALFVVQPAVLDDAERLGEVHSFVQEVSSRIPSYQRIQHLHFRATELPKTTSLRVRRDDIREVILAEHLKEPAPIAAAVSDEAWTPTDWQWELVCEIAEITGVDRSTIRLTHDFDRDLHLDSLMKVELLAALEKKLNLALPEQIALRFQTVQDVADYLAPYMNDCDGPVCPETLGDQPLDINASVEAETRYLRKSVAQKALARGFRFGARMFYRAAFRLRSVGSESLPKDSPYIIAANHASHLDSAAVIASLGANADNLHVLGAKDYFFDAHAKGWLVSTFLNVLPFDRHENFLRSLQLSQRAVEMGRSLLIFPEGTRSRTGELQPFKPGLGLLALELGAPIVPTYIDGTHQAMPVGKTFPKPSPVRVAFGAPIDVAPYRERREVEPPYPLYREITDRVRNAVEALRERLRASP